MLAFMAIATASLAFAENNAATALTAGWIPDTLDFKIQVPYDQSQANRYSVAAGIHHLWIFADDKTFSVGSKTLPRSEMRFMPDYTSGKHLFEADMLVPAGSDNMTIMQIHTDNAHEAQFGPVALMLQVHNGGSLYQGSHTPVFPDIYGKWFHLSVVHDVAAHSVLVYINNKLSGQFKDPGAPGYYFKCGVYSCHNPSPKMEVFIKNVKLWHQP